MKHLSRWVKARQNGNTRLRKGHLVRKAAHMTEYGILAILIAFHLKVCKVSGWKLFGISSVASITYAATDEFHQLFVPGNQMMNKRKTILLK